MDEGGTGVPNVDAIAEFNVQPLNAGGEAGRLHAGSGRDQRWHQRISRDRL